MSAQLDIFAPPSAIDAAFWAFEADNPQVYEMIVRLADEARRAGLHRIGMKAIFEQIRWQHMLSTRSHDFKLNNSYTSRYVRLIDVRNPELSFLFEKRAIKS